MYTKLFKLCNEKLHFSQESTAIKILYKIVSLADMTKIAQINDQPQLIKALSTALTQTFDYDFYKKMTIDEKEYIQQIIAQGLYEQSKLWDTTYTYSSTNYSWNNEASNSKIVKKGLQYNVNNFYNDYGDNSNEYPSIQFPTEFQNYESLGALIVKVLTEKLSEQIVKQYAAFQLGIINQLPMDIIQKIGFDLHKLAYQNESAETISLKLVCLK